MSSGSPRFCVYGGLEIDAQAELNPARAGVAVGWNVLGGDSAETRHVGRVQYRVHEGRVIESVEKVERIFHSDAFSNLGDFPDAEVQVLEPETTERVGASGGGIRGEKNGPEFLGCSGRVGKVVAVAVDAASEGTGVNKRNFSGREGEDGATAEYLVALLNEKRHAAAEADDPSGVPAADDLVDGLVTAAEAVAAAEGQVVAEGAVIDVSTVKERVTVLDTRE